MSRVTLDMSFRPNYDPEFHFGQLVEGRECGDCTACCKDLRIETPELQKPERQPCEHLSDKGCGIYENRFPVCRNWFCLWRRIDVMPEEARPDRSGLLFGLYWPNAPEHPFRKSYIFGLAIRDFEDFNSDLGIALVAMFKQGDFPLWISSHDTDRFLVHPSKDIVDVVMQRRKPRDRAEKAAAKAWESGVRQSC